MKRFLNYDKIENNVFNELERVVGRYIENNIISIWKITSEYTNFSTTTNKYKHILYKELYEIINN
jgi:hypothetical protein